MNSYVYGIGTDILKIQNIENSVCDVSDPFVKKTYTEKEIDLITSRPIPLNCFATRFAGKEAIFKCLNIFGNDIRLIEIEILEDTNHSPIVTLHGNAERIAKEKNITKILLSLSYDTDYAIAYATSLSTFK